MEFFQNIFLGLLFKCNSDRTTISEKYWNAFKRTHLTDRKEQGRNLQRKNIKPVEKCFEIHCNAQKQYISIRGK